MTPRTHTLTSRAVVRSHPCTVCGVEVSFGHWPEGTSFEPSTWWCAEHLPAELRQPAAHRPANDAEPWLCGAVSNLLGDAA